MSQTNITTKLVAFGDLLLRMSTLHGFRFTQANELRINVAGSEANVCALLSQLGIQTSYVTRVPDNDMAKLALNELHKFKIDTENCVFGGNRIGLYFVELGNQIRQSQIIYDRDHSSFATIGLNQIDWNKALDGATHFHWSGTSPGISYEASLACKEAIQNAFDKGLIISSDFNYRSKIWKYGKSPAEIMPPLLEYSSITVADLDSVEIYFNINTGNGKNEADRFQQAYAALKTKMPHLKTLAMSFRKSEGQSHVYSSMLMHEGNFYESKKHTIHLVTDQIGTGDAFTAGLLYGLMNKLPAQDCIEWATACGVIKQSNHGDFAIATAEEINHFLINGTSNRISR